jgi:DNA-binding NarL/FixJ family response regulator
LAGTAAEASGVDRDRDPDVVVIDVELPDGDGVALAEQFRAESGGPAVILLAARDDESLLMRALDAGCAGVVLRDRAFDELPAAAAAAHSGETIVPSARLVALLTRRDTGRADVAELTPRENEVLGLMAEGLSNEAIGERLHVSLNTVRNHVQRILTKLGAHSKLQAVAEASRRGLLPPR